MADIINLRDLLNHEILDLYSAEKQIINALPSMIERAYDPQLKNALDEHLEVTKIHKERLEKVQELLTDNLEDADNMVDRENQGFFSRLFGGVKNPKCKGIEGLIKEGKKIMAEDMTPEAMDAAIIASAQKIEHYEISGYGTAHAYARQLNLEFVATLLEQTLNDEYEADDLLTELAEGDLNIEAENATDEDGGNVDFANDRDNTASTYEQVITGSFEGRSL
jgi:ferritin-like metal-binding protein YciE